MGFNTAMVVLNDYTHEIRKDQEFGRKVIEAIQQSHRGDLHLQGFSILPSSHADNMQIIAVGGNSIKRLGYGHYTDDDEKLLRKLADQHGFNLVRKRAARKPQASE